MMGDTIRLNFGPPKFVVRCFPVDRKLGPVVLEVPMGAQLLGVKPPDHDPTKVYFWWAVPLDERPKSKLKFLIVEEEQPFEVEEHTSVVELDDGTMMEELHTHIQGVTFWTEPLVTTNGTGIKTVHVLEVLEDYDVSDPSVTPEPE
jgi:hypothetical protein